MKTKLLSILFVLFYSLLNAQINVSANFENGTFPSMWQTSNTSVTYAGAGCSSGYYAITCSSVGYANTPQYVTQGNEINLSFNYKTNSVSPLSGYVKLYYSIDAQATWVEIASNDVITYNCQTITATINQGVISSGTLVNFKLYCERSTGTGNIYMDDFVAIEKNSTEYTFDNTYFNTVGTNPFSSTTTNFVDDRHGNPTGALQLVGAQSTATIPATLLPTGAGTRTVSLWYKTPINNGYPGVFAYGANLNSQTFGMYLNPNGGPVFQGYANDTDFGGSYAVDTWQHVVISYGGGVVKMYKNGVYVSSVNKNLNTALASFKLGNSSVWMSFDDLKIYNYVLTDTEVANLYNYNSLQAPQMASINTITEKPAAINSTIYATVNPNGSAISNVVVKYGLTPGNLNNQVNAVAISSNYYYGAIINGLAENTTYYYKVEVTNAGGVTSSIEDTFTTGSKQTVAEYSFDQVYTNFLGNNAFTSSAGTSFGTDRNGNPNSALIVNNTAVNGQIPGLPIDASTRSVSLWAKIDSNSVENYPFSYGGILQDLSFISVLNSNTLEFQCFSNGFIVNETNPIHTWMHLVYTYDGVNVKMYKNGVLMGTSPFNLFTAYDDNYFYLASIWGATNTFNGSVDDLKIYNYALTPTEVSSLFTNNLLSTSDFQQGDLDVVLYPNPVKDVLHVRLENEVKSIEIYSIEGKKVLEATDVQVDMSALKSGVYFVRIEDEQQGVSTKRILKD